MFDIHIFTLYSLNQTILKEVKRKGKVRDTIFKGYKMLFYALLHRHLANGMLRDMNTSDTHNSVIHMAFHSVPVP